MVSSQTRKFVRERARSLCEYCHSPEYLNSDRFTMEHLLPQSLGGMDDVENLALALFIPPVLNLQIWDSFKFANVSSYKN
jgi:hypothetical protein